MHILYTDDRVLTKRRNRPPICATLLLRLVRTQRVQDLSHHVVCRECTVSKRPVGQRARIMSIFKPFFDRRTLVRVSVRCHHGISKGFVGDWTYKMIQSACSQLIGRRTSTRSPRGLYRIRIRCGRLRARGVLVRMQSNRGGVVCYQMGNRFFERVPDANKRSQVGNTERCRRHHARVLHPSRGHSLYHATYARIITQQGVRSGSSPSDVCAPNGLDGSSVHVQMLSMCIKTLSSLFPFHSFINALARRSLA